MSLCNRWSHRPRSASVDEIVHSSSRPTTICSAMLPPIGWTRCHLPYAPPSALETSKLNAPFDPARAAKPNGMKSPGISQYGSRNLREVPMRVSRGSCNWLQLKHHCVRWPASARSPIWKKAVASLDAVVTPARLIPTPTPEPSPQVGTACGALGPGAAA